MKLKDRLKNKFPISEIDEKINRSISGMLDDMVAEYEAQNIEIIMFLEELQETDKKFEKVNKKYLPDGFRQRCIDFLMSKKTAKTNGL